MRLNHFSVVYNSCKEAWRPGNLKEETYWIQFEGTSAPVEVRCAQQNGNVVVLFDHDSGNRMNVTGYEIPGSYRSENLICEFPAIKDKRFL